MIQVDQFSKAYGRLVAVDSLSFQVQPGDILGLVGRNGAGKTTTIRSLAGIVPPSAGEVWLGGYSMRQAPLQAKRHLAYIPDEPQLFEALTVREHLEFIRMAYQIGACEATIQQLLADFELAKKEHVPAEELSRGMRQKLQICCAYLHEPRVILFDEPMVGLDPHGIRQLKDSMVDRARAGAAIVISSHMLAMVGDICSHILMLDQGRATFWGTVSEMRQEFGGTDSCGSLEDAFFRAAGVVHCELA